MEDSGIDSGDTKTGYKNEDEKAFSTSDSSCGSNGSPRTVTPHVGTSSQGYSSKQLQRRLEQRIETARRLHNSRNNKPQSSPNGNSLIPIQRLPIPGCKEQQPLVEWDTEDSEEDIVNFFPVNRTKDNRQQELTDTFSIEEMSVSGAEDEEDDLHLVPPLPVYKKFGCCGAQTDKCSIM